MEENKNKTKKVIALFSAASFVLGAGCATAANKSENEVLNQVQNASTAISDDDTCWDIDNNGYCDGDGSSIDNDSFIFVNVGGIQQKRYFKKEYAPSYTPPTTSYKPPTSTPSSGTTVKPSTSTVKPPTSSSGTGAVVNKNSSGTATTSGISSGTSAKGGIGSSSGGSSS